MYGLPDANDAALRALHMVEMVGDADRATGGYSKGMKQRIKIAAALVHDPEVLLLDEPFNGMDPRQRLQMMELLGRMAEQGRTILFSSHILEEVERLGENVLVVVAGRLAAAGDFRAIRKLMTDRPHTITIRSSDNRGLATALMAEDSVFGVELADGKVVVRTNELGTFTSVAPRAAQAAAASLFEVTARGRVARERLRVPGDAMTVLVLTLTLRQLLGQKRTLFLAAVGLLPVLAAIIFRVAADADASAAEFAAQVVLNALVINILLPLTALVLATAALGSEIEDGTIVYLLSKPVERWRIVAGKLLAAWGATAVLVLASAVIGGIVTLAGEGESRILAGFVVAVVPRGRWRTRRSSCC